MNRPLEIVACIGLVLVALAAIGALITSYVLHADPAEGIVVGLIGVLSTCVGAVAGIVATRGASSS